MLKPSPYDSILYFQIAHLMIHIDFRSPLSVENIHLISELHYIPIL